MELTKEKLNEYRNNYKNNKSNKILESALSSLELKKVIRNPRVKQSTISKFSTDLKTLPVTNQEHSGRCWMFAGLNIIRESIAKKYNLEELELSQNYLTFYDKLEKVNYIMDSIIDLGNYTWDDRTIYWFLTFGYSEGGIWSMFQNLVNKYGIVPKDAVTETFQALNSNQMQDLIYASIKKFTGEAKGLDYDDRVKLKDRYMEDVYDFLTMCYGVMPTKFDFEYVDKDKKYGIEKGLTPKEFYEMSGIDVDDYVVLLNAPSSNKPLNKTYTVKYSNNMTGGKDPLYLNLPIEDLKLYTEKQLNDKLPVWFTCDCLPYFDRDNGVWDIDLYNYMDAFNLDLKADKGLMLDFGMSAPNHAMVFTGYNDYPKRYKVENTWGDEKGAKGYYTGTEDWYDTYVYQVAIHKKYLSKELKELLDTKPIELDPWDPIGAVTK